MVQLVQISATTVTVLSLSRVLGTCYCQIVQELGLGVTTVSGEADLVKTVSSVKQIYLYQFG